MLKFIAYYMNEKDGVGAVRSIFLYKMLEKTNIPIEVFSRDTFGNRISGNMRLWILKVLIELLKSKNNVVYVSCGPFRQLFFIAIACLISGHKLIVDFRDGWSVNIANNYGVEKKLSVKRKALKAISELIEKITYKVCEAFIVCTPGLKKAYSNIFADDKKIYTIINGHMIGKIKYKNNRRNECLKVVCTGKFLEYGKNAIEKLHNFEECLKKNYGPEICYTIYFVGTDAITQMEFKDRKHVVIKPRMTYEKMISFISDADIGLVMVRNEELELGTKVFDYIGAGVPVFDWFQDNSMFHTYFKRYLFKKIKGAKYMMPHDGVKFHREQNIMRIVKLIKNIINNEK